MWKCVSLLLALTALAAAQPTKQYGAPASPPHKSNGAYPYQQAYVPYAAYPGFPYAGFPYNYHGFPYNYVPHAPHVPHVPHVAPKPAAYVPPTVHATQLTYRGQFHGTCEGQADGLYYVDERSFAFCSAGIKTIQACADGSINPAHDEFSSGKYQHFYDFCSINLAARDYVASNH